MHDVLRTRVLRKLESLPEDQVYQVLDYIEFLESKYAPDLSSDTTALQSFAEKLEDQLRRRTVSPGSLREAFQLIAEEIKPQTLFQARRENVDYRAAHGILTVIDHGVRA